MRPNADSIISDRTGPFNGYVWRGHRRHYDGLDAGGSRLANGRFHRAPGRGALGDVWPALYTALDLAVSLGENMRSRPTTFPRELRFTEILAELEAVADCRDLTALGVDRGRLFDDYDFSTGQALARVVRDTGAEGFLIASATKLGDNLVLFPDRLRSQSTLTVIQFKDANLTRERR